MENVENWSFTPDIIKLMNKYSYNDVINFIKLCSDCLYYGYYYKFIENNYFDNWTFTKKDFKAIYDFTFEKLAN